MGLVPWAEGGESGSHPKGPHPTCPGLELHPPGCPTGPGSLALGSGLQGPCWPEGTFFPELGA